jgi:hypothetical protein
VATDLAESYRNGLSPHLDHATASLTRSMSYGRPIGVSMRSVGECRTNSSVHRGPTHDPLYRIRKLLIAGSERIVGDGTQRLLLGLRAGDPNDEILGAWLAKESVPGALDADNPADAEVLLDKTIRGCLDDPVAEIRALGKTLQRWRSEILAHHHTAASNGPTEGLNLLVKRSSAAAEGSRTTGSACSYAPDDQHGHNDHHHPSSEPHAPTLTRRATKGARAQPLSAAGSQGTVTVAVYRSNWCSLPSGLSPVLLELSDQAG